MEDVQSAWALLLHCAGGRVNYMLRVVRPEAVQRFAEGHTNGLWECLSNIMGSSVEVDPQFVTHAHCPCPWEAWGFGTPHGRAHQRAGQVGRIVLAC